MKANERPAQGRLIVRFETADGGDCSRTNNRTTAQPWCNATGALSWEHDLMAKRVLVAPIAKVRERVLVDEPDTRLDDRSVCLAEASDHRAHEVGHRDLPSFEPRSERRPIRVDGGPERVDVVALAVQWFDAEPARNIFKVFAVGSNDHDGLSHRTDGAASDQCLLELFGRVKGAGDDDVDCGTPIVRH